jgi:hypothetical protein
MLGEQIDGEVDRFGRLTVEPDLTLPGHPEVFAIGDMVRVRTADGSVVTLPGLAPVAMQQGRYVAGLIRRRLSAPSRPPFHYRDKGNLATIGRSKAVAEIGPARIAGFPAWALWLGVHVFYLIGFQNRLLVLLRWTISFFTHGRGARLIGEDLHEGLLERPRLVDGDDEQRPSARVPEPVRRLRRHDEHLIRLQVDDVVTRGPAAGSLEEHERLRVGVHVELDALARRRPHDEDGDADAGARETLEQRGRGAELQLVEIEKHLAQLLTR